MTRPQPDNQQPWRERHEVERAYHEDGAEVQWAEAEGEGLKQIVYWTTCNKDNPPTFQADLWWRVKPKRVTPRKWDVFVDEIGRISQYDPTHKLNGITVVELKPGWRLVPPGGES